MRLITETTSNLVGDNVGEGTEGTYIPSFIKPTTPTISRGRQGLVATNVGKLILWAGGISGPYPGDESNVVDTCDVQLPKFSPTATLSKARNGISMPRRAYRMLAFLLLHVQ